MVDISLKQEVLTNDTTKFANGEKPEEKASINTPYLLLVPILSGFSVFEGRARACSGGSSIFLQWEKQGDGQMQAAPDCAWKLIKNER